MEEPRTKKLPIMLAIGFFLLAFGLSMAFSDMINDIANYPIIIALLVIGLICLAFAGNISIGKFADSMGRG